MNTRTTRSHVSLVDSQSRPSRGEPRTAALRSSWIRRAGGAALVLAALFATGCDGSGEDMTEGQGGAGGQGGQGGSGAEGGSGGSGTTTSSAATTTSSAATTTSSTETEEMLLEEGTYQGEVTDLQDNTCADFIEFFLAPGELTWTGPDTFEVSFGGLVQKCTVDGGAVSCVVDSSSLDVTPDAVIEFHSVISDFEVISSASFSQIETVSIPCVGAGCAALAEEFSISFPCGVVVTELFAK